MKQTYSRWHISIILTAQLLLLGAAPCYGYLFRDDKHGTELSLFGLGEIRLNYATVEGDSSGFAESTDGFAEQFDTREFLSFTVNGTLYRNYALEGELQYDKEDYPDWNMHFKLSRNEHYLLVGDQPNIFSDAYFTRYASPFRGVTLHAESQRFNLTTFGAVTKGSAKREELTPDGTSGPYRLTSIPVVPGSEIITLEVRDRQNQEQVLETLPQEQDIDYTFDDDAGEIMFAEAVNSETIYGDPIVIVVAYRSEEASSAFGTVAMGARMRVNLFGQTAIGAAYISEFAHDPTLEDGFRVRQEVYSVESAFSVGDFMQVATEHAFSRNHQEPESPRLAFRVTTTGSLGQSGQFSGEYRQVERDFLIFANPAVKPAEEEVKMNATYAILPQHTIELGYRFLRDNLPRDPNIPTTTTHRPYIAWNAGIGEQTALYAKYDFVHSSDDQSPKTTDTQTHTVLIGGTREFSTVPALTKMLLQGEYQFSSNEDRTAEGADSMTHQVRLRIRSDPVEDVAVYGEQQEQFVYDKGLKKTTERQDTSEIGLELKRWERFSMLSTYQYRTTHDLLEMRRTSQRHTASLSVNAQPFSALEASGKVEFRDETLTETAAAEENGSSQTLRITSQLLFSPQKDLNARLHYEYSYTNNHTTIDSTALEDELELRLNYAFDRRKTRVTGAVKLERDLLETPPTPNTETQTITYSVNGTRQLTDRWEVFAQYKREMTTLAAENFREDILGEIGHKVGRFIEFAGGYQYSRFRDHDDSANDYAANSIYLKIVGKL